MNNVNLIDALWPNNKSQNYLRKISIIIFGTVLLAVSAHVKIPIPPVPVTLQTLVVLVFAMTVGRNLAFITFLFYLFQGSIGIPVFANAILFAILVVPFKDHLPPFIPGFTCSGPINS